MCHINCKTVKAWSPTNMWSSNKKVWSPKWENEESNFWHKLTYSLIINVTQFM